MIQRIMLLRMCSILSIVFLLTIASLATAAETALKKGDRIVFLGDSITAGGVKDNGYVTFVRNALNEKLADLGIEVFGAEVSGNKVPDLQRRLEKDVLSKKPTVVVIYIGINDVWHSERGNGTSKEAYEAGLKDLIKSINDAGARVILCTASVIGEKTDGSNTLDKMLDEYCDISRKVAADTKTQLLDLRKAFLDYLQKNNPKNEEKGILTPDRVHLNLAGNRLVANEVLAALGVSMAPPKVLRHVVLFKFKPAVTPAEIQEVVDAFGSLPAKIDAIHSFEWGTDVSVEKKAAGFTHCFFVTFRDEKGRDIYLPHPAHEQFKKLVGPRLADVLVFDYWTQP